MVAPMAIGISTLLEPALLALVPMAIGIAEERVPQISFKSGWVGKRHLPYRWPAMTSPICVVPTS